MPRRKDTPSNGSLGNFSTNYIDFSYDEQQHIKSLSSGRTHTLRDIVESAGENGWKVSVSYSSSWGTWVFSITPKDVPDYPSNTVYIIRHSDFDTTIDCVFYFFNTMVENGDDRLRGKVSGFDW